MSIWSRDFTRFEKGLLLTLALILVGLAYYQFVDRPVRRTIAESEAECAQLETELSVVSAKAAHLEKLNDDMEAMKTDGSGSYMASYNNAKEEVSLLNDILVDTLQYTIAFADVTRSNDQIRRRFTLQFRTKDYQDMQKVIDGLCNSKYRCQVGDIQCSIARDKNGTSYVAANVTATFFETMVGGTPDAGLPEDKAAEQKKAS